MNWTGLKPFALLLLGVVFAATLLAAPTFAQTRQSTPWTDGEPTEPDIVIEILEANDVDLADYGLTAPAEDSDSVIDSWVQALIDLLYTLGLITEGDSD